MSTNEEMRTEFCFFREVWTLFKKYYNGDRTDTEWDALIEDASAINQKYHCELCKDLIIAVMNELERRGKLQENKPPSRA
jgi:hypothetical protein